MNKFECFVLWYAITVLLAATLNNLKITTFTTAFIFTALISLPISFLIRRRMNL